MRSRDPGVAFSGDEACQGGISVLPKTTRRGPRSSLGETPSARQAGRRVSRASAPPFGWRPTWRKRVFQPTARQAQATRRPYDLRHTFCSLLLYEGQTAVEVAEQVGNSATMIYDTYAHVIAEAKGGERLSAEAQIKAARERGVSEKCPPKSAEASSIAANRL